MHPGKKVVIFSLDQKIIQKSLGFSFLFCFLQTLIPTQYKGHTVCRIQRSSPNANSIENKSGLFTLSQFKIH